MGKHLITRCHRIAFLTDDQLALVMTYIRQNFSNKSSEVTADEVAKERKTTIANNH